MNLNHQAYEAAREAYRNSCSLDNVIRTYLEACDKPASNQPFDSSLVKPGDEVLVSDGAFAPYKFLATTSNGKVVLEDGEGDVATRFVDECSLPPKPRKTVTVQLFRDVVNGKIEAFSDTRFDRLLALGWEPCSEFIEIEVTK